MSNFDFARMLEYWNRDAEAFRKLSRQYYLYK
jgi:hypothetical protein